MPRIKKTARTQRPAALDALAALTRAKPEARHAQAFIDELNREKNDRGAAILVVTNVENMLQTVLEYRLKIHEKQYDRLFRSEAPLASFENKIQVAYALEVFGTEMFDNLNYIKAVRNAFAHARNPITFDTPEVIAVCNLLKKPAIASKNALAQSAFDHDWANAVNARMRFIIICNIMAHNLRHYAMYATDNFISPHSQNPGLQTLVRPRPLP